MQMGRTGRKRDGRIVMLMSEGREEHTYNTSVYQKKNLLKNMISGDKLRPYLSSDQAPMIPKGLVPRCHEMPMTVVHKQPVPSTNARKKVSSISFFYSSFDSELFDFSLLLLLDGLFDPTGVNGARRCSVYLWAYSLRITRLQQIYATLWNTNSITEPLGFPLSFEPPPPS